MQSQTIPVTKNYYAEQRLESDIDLIAIVRQILVEAGLQHNVVNHYDNDHYVLEALNKRPEVQRFLLNQYWNLQLMAAPVNSMNERFSLVPNGSLDEWLNLFQATIVPFAIRHSLPRGID
jgi:ankyrin repeat protein